MSSDKRFIVNCGASHVSCSVFSTKGGALTLEDLKVEPLNYDYSDESGWATAVTQCLGSILATLKVKGEVELIAPGYQLLTKSIKAPSVEPQKQFQIIAFEAQQNIPYPLREVVWGHQVIADDGIEADVILIACKSDVVNGFCRAVSMTGIKPVSVQAAALLDYNAFRYAYGVEGTTLLINIGARSSTFLFISPEGLFVRTINLGGNSLTQAISDGIGQTFAEAETTKTGYFNGEIELAEGDATLQIIQQSSNNFMRRLGQDITRSVVNYKRQKQGETPAQILLTGRGALLPGLVENLGNSQGVYVDYFDPTQAMSLGSRVDQNYLCGIYYQLSEVLGLACSDLLPDSAGIELLPSQIASDQAFAKKKALCIVSAAFLAIAPAPAIVTTIMQEAAYDAATIDVDAAARPLQKLIKDIGETRKQAEEINATINKFEEIVKSKSNWINFFADLQDRLFDVKDVWIDKLEVVRTVEEKPKDEKNKQSKFKKKKPGEEEEKVVVLEPDLYILKLTGRLLLRKAEGTDELGLDEIEAGDRLELFRKSIRKSEFVKDVERQQLVVSDPPRVLEFTFHITINPDMPL